MRRNKNKLSKEQKQQFMDWLAAHLKGNPNCSICQANTWLVSDHILSPPIMILEGREKDSRNTIYPQVLLVCDNCGHTLYFNAFRVGVFEKLAEELQANEKEIDFGDLDG